MNDHSILESISDGVFTVDKDFRITYLNRSAEEILRIQREDAIGQLCCNVFHSSLCEGACALRRTLDLQTPIIDLSCFIIDNEGRRVPVSISTAVLRDQTGGIIGGAETFRNLSVIEQLRKELDAGQRIGDLTSHSRSMHKIFSQFEAVAETGSTVLITGETGSGKELLARTIHAHSPRRDKPFVAINCGAFPDNLLGSEMFGYKRGAFTGADHDRPGRFAAAEGGTLFLDEIGEISMPMQVCLLRVLQERTYEPLGSSTSVKSDVRIVCATHRNLPDLIATGTFRQDLFYRINVIQLEMPPLRNRIEDIPFLADAFVRRFNLALNRHIAGISRSALKILMAYRWPGNVRELENAIERAMVFCRGETIESKDLPPEFAVVGQPAAMKKLKTAVGQSETEMLTDALVAAGGDRREAARRLGIHYSTFYRKLKVLKISPSLPDGRHRGRTVAK